MRRSDFMNKNAAVEFVLQNARPLELAVYKYLFENKSNQTVVDELVKYFNNYKYENSNQLDEFYVMIKNNEKLKSIIEHLYNTLQIKLTQLQVKQLIATEIINKLNVKINFN